MFSLLSLLSNNGCMYPVSSRFSALLQERCQRSEHLLPETVLKLDSKGHNNLLKGCVIIKTTVVITPVNTIQSTR